MTEPETSSESPLRLYETEVRPEWVDYNGHMSEAFYVLVFGYTTDALLEELGVDAGYRERSGTSVYTLESHVHYLREVLEGERLEVSTQLLDADYKRVHVFHSMYRAEGGDLLATCEVMLMNVDRSGPRSAPFAAEASGRLRALLKAHQHLPRPEQAGDSIGLG